MAEFEPLTGGEASISIQGSNGNSKSTTVSDGETVNFNAASTSVTVNVNGETHNIAVDGSSDNINVSVTTGNEWKVQSSMTFSYSGHPYYTSPYTNGHDAVRIKCDYDGSWNLFGDHNTSQYEGFPVVLTQSQLDNFDSPSIGSVPDGRSMTFEFLDKEAAVTGTSVG